MSSVHSRGSFDSVIFHLSVHRSLVQQHDVESGELVLEVQALLKGALGEARALQLH